MHGGWQARWTAALSPFRVDCFRHCCHSSWLPQVVLPDIEATDGWLHGVSRLLIPPPLYEEPSVFAVSAADAFSSGVEKNWGAIKDAPILLQDPTLELTQPGATILLESAEAVEAAVAEMAVS